MKNKKIPENLIKIGELAVLAGVFPSAINFWTKEGLLKFAEATPGGYRLYDRSNALLRIKEIRRLQKINRLTIMELKKRFRVR